MKSSDNVDLFLTGIEMVYGRLKGIKPKKYMGNWEEICRSIVKDC